MQFLSQARAMRSAFVNRLYCAVCAVFTGVLSTHLLLTEEQRRIVQFRLNTNLLRSIVWIPTGLVTIFRIVARILAASFPVALQWLAIMEEEVV